MQRKYRHLPKQPKKRPHPYVQEHNRNARRKARGWLISKICDIAEDVSYFHAERPKRSTGHQAARRAGAAACAFFIGVGALGVNHLKHNEGSEHDFRLEATPQPMAATDSSRLPEASPDHDPSAYASVDMASVEQSIATSATTSFNSLATLEIGGAGFMLIGGAGALQRRRRRELEARPVVVAASSQMATFQHMLQPTPNRPAPEPVTALQSENLVFEMPLHIAPNPA